MSGLVADNFAPVTFDSTLIKSKKQNQSISAIYSELCGKKCMSIELCPDRELNINLLHQLKPSFCSVTWHRPSSGNLNVDEIPALVLAKQLCNQGYNVLLHIAARNLNKTQALEILNEAKNVGVRNILALTGDQSQVVETDDSKCDFPYAGDFTRFIRKHFQEYFCVGVAAYPEISSSNSDILHLKQKITFADFIVTQACFDYEIFEKFWSICRSNSINIPIIPGLFFISSHKSLVAMVKFCGLKLPENIMEFVEKNKNNTEVVQEYGITHAVELIGKLLQEGGFQGIHVFSLNNLEFVDKVLSKLDGNFVFL